MADRLFEHVGLNKREAKEFVDAFFEVVREALERGEQVKLSSFGSFGIRSKGERIGRNPKTGQEVPITPRRVLVFKPSNIMKETINEQLSKKSRANGNGGAA